MNEWKKYFNEEEIVFLRSLKANDKSELKQRVMQMCNKALKKQNSNKDSISIEYYFIYDILHKMDIVTDEIFASLKDYQQEYYE